jgi:hypothetical protein
MSLLTITISKSLKKLTDDFIRQQTADFLGNKNLKYSGMNMLIKGPRGMDC